MAGGGRAVQWVRPRGLLNAFTKLLAAQFQHPQITVTRQGLSAVRADVVCQQRHSALCWRRLLASGASAWHCRTLWCQQTLMSASTANIPCTQYSQVLLVLVRQRPVSHFQSCTILVTKTYAGGPSEQEPCCTNLGPEERCSHCSPSSAAQPRLQAVAKMKRVPALQARGHDGSCRHPVHRGSGCGPRLRAWPVIPTKWHK